MKYPNPCAGALFCLLLLALPAGAASNPEARQAMARVVEQVLSGSPEIAAARSAIQAAEARLRGAGLPIHNPELSADYENTDVNTWSIGVNQAIDWHDKRGAREQVARVELELARQQLAALRLEKSRELVDAMGRILILRRIDKLAEERVNLLMRFEKLVTKRLRAGDLSTNDLTLARLSLAEADMLKARSRAELIQAGIDYQSISSRPLDDAITLPDLYRQELPEWNDEEVIRNHPLVQSALLEARVARERVQAADRDRKADPTLGIAGGQDDDNALVALSFALPLQIRNSFDNEVDAARAEALMADQLAQQRHRTLSARLRGSREQFRTLYRGWELWLKGGHGSILKRAKFLERLWQAGEMSTTDYLLQLQQTLDIRITGIEFEGDLWSAWVGLLEASATLDHWLKGEEK